MVKNKYNILIDYPIKKSYTGLTFPPILYNFLIKDERYNVYHANLKFPKNKLDAIIVFSAGSHFDLHHNTFFTITFNQIISRVYPRIKKMILRLGLILGLNNLLFYKRFFFSNRGYEKRIDRILKLNPNIKLIHRLEGSYQNICKVYGFDKTVKYIK